MNQDFESTANEISQELVESALAAWCDLLDQGKSVDRSAFLEQYDEATRADLSQCLEAFDFIRRAVPSPHAPSAGHTKPSTRDAEEFGLPFRLGDFEVEEEIGRGGMGVVYRAVQVSLNRSVAIKILPFAALLDGRQLVRFRNEARAAGMLKHPNIVGVLSVGYERGLHYYAMELVEGCSLAEIIRTLGNEEHTASPSAETTPVAELSTKFSSDRSDHFRSVARIGIQAGNALQTAHEAGIVHRDIKPSNLLIDRDGRPLIADFGLARMQSDQGVTMSGDVLGTLRYMSPEQLQNSHAADQRSDVYSLGLTLYELMARRPAFDSTEKAHLISKIVDGDLAPLSREVSTIPQDLETIVAKAVSLNADSRYQTASELTADLQRFVDGKPVLARRVGTLERVFRWSKRNRSKAVLCALLAGIVLAAAIGGPIVAFQQRIERQRQTELVRRQKHEAYSREMRHAQGLIDRGQVDRAIRLLQDYVPNSKDNIDYRNFEWRFLATQCAPWREAKTLAISHAFETCDLSSDEKWLAAGTMFGGVAVFETRTGRSAWISIAHRGGIYRVCFSTNNKWLITCGYDKKIKFFDVNNGSQLLSERMTDYPQALATYGNKLLVCMKPEGQTKGPNVDRTNLRLFEISDSAETPALTPLVRVEDLPDMRALRFSPDGRLATAACADGMIRLWDSSSLDLVKSNVLTRHERMTSVDFSTNGKSLVVGSSYRDDRRSPANAYIVDVETLKKRATLPHSTEVSDARYAEDATCLTATFDGKIRLWSQDGKLLQQRSAASKGISEIAVKRGGIIYAACRDSKLRQVPPSTSSTNNEIGDFWGGMDVSFHPNGQEVAAGTNTGQMRIYDVVSGDLKHETDVSSYRIWATSYSRNGKYLAVTASPWPTNQSESMLVILDAAKGTKIHEIEIPDVNYARSLQFAPDDNQLAVVGNGKLLFFDMEQMKFSTPVDAGDNGSHVFYVDFTRDGKFVGTTTAWGGGGGIRIWRYPSMEQVLYVPGKERPYWWGFALDSTGKHFAVSDHVKCRSCHFSSKASRRRTYQIIGGSYEHGVVYPVLSG